MNKKNTYIVCSTQWQFDIACEFYDLYKHTITWNGKDTIVLVCVEDSITGRLQVVSYTREWLLKSGIDINGMRNVSNEAFSWVRPEVPWFIKTRQDYRKIFIGDEIYSESHRWRVKIKEIREDTDKTIILTGDCMDNDGKRVFGIELKEYEVLQWNYRLPTNKDY
jgi:hypothetical protein